jgi:hypothetical protein
MKRFALLRIEDKNNKVIFDCNAKDLASAVKIFNASMTNAQLNEEGYCTLSATAALCVAEFFEPFHTIN